MIVRARGSGFGCEVVIAETTPTVSQCDYPEQDDTNGHAKLAEKLTKPESCTKNYRWPRKAGSRRGDFPREEHSALKTYMQVTFCRPNRICVCVYVMLYMHIFRW